MVPPAAKSEAIISSMMRRQTNEFNGEHVYNHEAVIVFISCIICHNRVEWNGIVRWPIKITLATYAHSPFSSSLIFFFCGWRCIGHCESLIYTTLTLKTKRAECLEARDSWQSLQVLSPGKSNKNKKKFMPKQQFHKEISCWNWVELHVVQFTLMLIIVVLMFVPMLEYSVAVNYFDNRDTLLRHKMQVLGFSLNHIYFVVPVECSTNA